MGVWIVIAIILFVLGSMMALKPSGIDMRLDTLRMTARKIGLNPKLVACPEWVAGKDGEFGRGMIGQYGIVLDDIKLPHARYQVIEGQWRPAKHDEQAGDTIPAHFGLDKVALNLPATIEPFVKALTTQANSIIIYWEDIAYVRPITNPTYSRHSVEPDLLVLKDQLTQWAQQLQQANKSR